MAQWRAGYVTLDAGAAASDEVICNSGDQDRRQPYADGPGQLVHRLHMREHG